MTLCLKFSASHAHAGRITMVCSKAVNKLLHAEKLLAALLFTTKMAPLRLPNFRGQSPNFDTASAPEFEGIPCSCCKTGVMRVHYPLRQVQQDYG